jgi:hypothetical protein
MNYCENIVIIPSLVNVAGYYTREKRYIQTIKTISSVREKIPNSFIVLIDISEFTEEETVYLNKICNLFINENKNDILIKKVKHQKSYGEKSYIQYALLYLNEFNDDYKFSKFINLKSIFKVGGRYYLNDKFDYNNYNNELDNVKILPMNLYKNGCESCIFKINVKNIKSFVLHLENEDHGVYRGLSTHNMENLVYSYIMQQNKNSYIHLNILGMTALPASGGAIFDV